MKKRFLALLLCLGLLLQCGLFLSPVTAAEQYTDPETGLRYTINAGSATVAVQPAGTTFPERLTIPASISYNGEEVPVTAMAPNAFCYAAVKEVVIKAPLTAIPSTAFKGCMQLQKITLPNTLTSIEAYAFKSCSNLRSIYIPQSVVKISTGAFENCYRLETINLPEGLTQILESAFACCSALKTIQLPSTLHTIEPMVFNRSGLTRIVLPAGISAIRTGAFNDCAALTEIILKNVTAPAVTHSTFAETPATLYVPNEAVKTGLSGQGIPDERILVRADFLHELSFRVASYDPKKPTTAALYPSTDGGTTYAAEPVATVTSAPWISDTADCSGNGLGFGLYTQTFTIPDLPDGVYQLVVTKPGHLSYTVTGLPIEGEKLDLTVHKDPALNLLSPICGDVGGDGKINYFDKNVFNTNCVKPFSEADPLCDLNGDGVLDAKDRDFIDQNYNALPTVVSYYVYTNFELSGRISTSSCKIRTTFSLYQWDEVKNSYRNSPISTLVLRAHSYRDESFVMDHPLQDFTFYNIAPGKYKLVIQKDSYLDYSIEGITISSSSVDFTTLPIAELHTFPLIAGDLNGDGIINEEDLDEITILNNLWPGDETAKPQGYLYADVNGDGVIDEVDIALVRSNFGKIPSLIDLDAI